MAGLKPELSGDFDGTQDRVTAIKDIIMKHMLGSCVLRADMLEIAQNPAGHNVTGSNATELKRIGILDENGNMPEDFRAVILAVFPGVTMDENQACPYPDFSRLEQ